MRRLFACTGREKCRNAGFDLWKAVLFRLRRKVNRESRSGNKKMGPLALQVNGPDSLLEFRPRLRIRKWLAALPRFGNKNARLAVSTGRARSVVSAFLESLSHRTAPDASYSF